MKTMVAAALIAASGTILAWTAQETPETQEVSYPEALKPGFEKLLAGENETALKAWLKGGPIEGDSYIRKLKPAFDQVNGLFGKPVDYSWIKDFTFGARSKVAFAVVNAERGAFFLKFTLYRTPKGSWVVNPLVINTEIEEVATGGYLEKLID